MAQAKDNALVKTAHIKQRFTEQDIQDITLCATDPHYFLDNFFYIQHPTKGKMQYKAFEYQKRLIDSYHDHRFNVNLLPRQTGKTTTAAGYLLWYAMFVPDSTILIAAHKYTGAKEIMLRIRYAYELCPDHIRPGVTSYNKESIEFDNGSRIVAQTTTETTGRGMSLSMLYCDEFAFVPPNIATEFWTSISPTLATGGKAIITSTPNSDEDQFALIWHEANKKFDEHGNEQEVGRNGFFPFKAHWSEHPDRDDKWKAEELGRIGEERFRREHECIHGDSLITVKWPNGKIQKVTILELEQILFVEELLKNNLGLQVLTDTGWSNFDGLLIKGNKQTVLVRTQSRSIICTLDHNFFNNKFEPIEAKKLYPGIKIQSNGGLEKIVAVTLATVEPVYDLFNVEKNHRFYANGMLVKNCEFLIFDETLINSINLAAIEGSEPLMKMGQCRWYKKINPDSTYIISLDPSLGTGGDYAALEVIEIPSFEQVAEWHHNMTPVQAQARILRDICKYIEEQCYAQDKSPSIYYSVENNTVGEAALVAINELGEESIPGLFLSEPIKKGHVRRFRKGFNTTEKAKIAGCAKLKQLIEQKILKLHSKPLISELKTFVAHGVTYKAKSQEHDDLVMSLLLNVRMIMMLQDWDPSVYEKMHENMQEETILPMPIYIG